MTSITVRLKPLFLVGEISALSFLGVQTTRWAFSALRTWMAATFGAIFMSTMVVAQAPPAAIARVADAYAQNMRAGDARALAALYLPNGFEMPPHLPAVKGRAAIEQRYEAFFKGPVKFIGFTLTPIEARIEGDLAYDVGTYDQRLLLPDGKTVTDVGKWVVVLRRMQGEWKIAYATYNSDVPQIPCSSH